MEAGPFKSFRGPFINVGEAGTSKFEMQFANADGFGARISRISAGWTLSGIQDFVAFKSVRRQSHQFSPGLVGSTLTGTNVRQMGVKSRGLMSLVGMGE